MSQFVYLLNAMESAAMASNPALEEYGIKRRKVLEYVEELEKRAQPEAETHWMEDELMEVMRIVSPGMVGKQPDEITYAILVTAIRRLMEADTERYEALLERWQKRHSAAESKPQRD